MPNLLIQIADAVDWWANRRDQSVTMTEAFKEVGVTLSKDAMSLLAEWWTLAEEEYRDTLSPSRELTTKDDWEIATLMGSLVYSFCDGEPSGRFKKLLSS